MLNPALGYLVTMLGARLDKARRGEGASAVEWVVIAAVLVTVCGIIGVILISLLLLLVRPPPAPVLPYRMS